jgi:DMSO/TMAO reductase YedYZ heme-binding membrane subunit
MGNEVDGKLLQPITVRLLAIVLGGSGLYAVLRYIVFGTVAPQNWPLYVGNKIASLGGLTLLALSYLVGKVPGLRPGNRALELVVIKFCGLLGFSLIGMHMVASLLLMDPAYYAKFFGDGKMNLTGELSMAAGIFGLWCFCLPVVTTAPRMHEELGAERWLRSQRMGYVGLAATVVHVVVMGWAGWWTPETWPASMPPITILAFVVAVVPLLVKLSRR